ncbi:unnamed protein product [Blepharisma stoltei]|uniref:Uncharacterized protein n=1 Tax=Blepharisma stoltei TaxID=1481888 RepID=A0AAU9ISF7_9CILI|nr:unnamed protein product [Blepharisma stoltei]
MTDSENNKTIMKLSIFRQIDEDANKSCAFWHKPDEKSIIDINTNKLHQGNLLITNGKGSFQNNFYVLTTSSLYKYKENNKDLESVSNIRWKILEPFLEQDKALSSTKTKILKTFTQIIPKI